MDSQEQLELVSVDKEVAEERAEAAELELEEVKEQMAHMEVELQVLREGGGVYIPISLSSTMNLFLTLNASLLRRGRWKGKRN